MVEHIAGPAIPENEDCSILPKVAVLIYEWNLDKNVYGAYGFPFFQLSLKFVPQTPQTQSRRVPGSVLHVSFGFSGSL